MEVIMSSPVNECSSIENAECNGTDTLTKSKKRRLNKKLRKLNAENLDSNQQLHQNDPKDTPATEDQKYPVLAMSSPVHERSSIENAEGNGTPKLTRSQKKSLNKKLRKLNAENPENNQQLHQNDPKGTTATVDQILTMSSPVHECSTMENAEGNGTPKMTKPKRNRLNKKPRKLNAENPESNQELHQNDPKGTTTATEDQKYPVLSISSPVHECSSMENSEGNGTVKLTRSQKKSLNKKLRKLNAENPESNQQLHQNTPNNNPGTPATVPVLTMSSPVHEPSSMENAEGSTPTLTKSKKKKPRKLNVENPDSNQQLHQNDPKGTPATVDQRYPVLSPDEETHMVTHSKKRMLDEIANSDANTEVVGNGEMGSKKRKKKKVKITDFTEEKKEAHISTNQSPTLDEISNPQYLELQKQEVENEESEKMEKEKMEKEKKKAKKKAEKMVNINEPGFVKGEKRKKPTLEEPEKDEAKRALSEEMSKSNKRVKVKAVDSSSHGQPEVKPRNDEIITRVPVMRKKLLIFDVNGILADVVSPRPKDRVADRYIPKRAIFKRPFLDDFLRFCFERFDVGIWSSRTKKVLYPVVDYLLRDQKKNLLFIWDNSKCKKAGKGIKTLEDKHKPMVFKNLRKIWENNGPNNSWWEGTFHESNTLLVDDSPYKALINPKNTGIFPLSYSYMDRNDNSLGPNGDIRTYLEGLADSDDVQKYVEQHPFGQPAIDQTHPNWDFYSKILEPRK